MRRYLFVSSATLPVVAYAESKDAMRATRKDGPREGWDASASHWRVTLRRDRASMTTDYSMGAEWLRRLVYTSRGTVRRTEAAQQFTAADLRVLQACIARPAFRLVELDPHSDGRYLRDLAPVYRCIGESFDYTASAWQSGGAFAILRHA